MTNAIMAYLNGDNQTRAVSSIVNEIKVKKKAFMANKSEVKTRYIRQIKHLRL